MFVNELKFFVLFFFLLIFNFCLIRGFIVGEFGIVCLVLVIVILLNL